MLSLRGIAAVLTAIALLFCIGTANAEELHKFFSHSLSIGNQQSFLVSKYTLILVIDLNGHARVAQLHQLKPDWKCSLAFDVPDDYENSDFTLTDEETGLKYADNMMVYYQP
ncbi:MAG: hypothetical protein PWR01_4614 [Clostridiales bacterium]|jgi:hypothetical protein|nr:hypothetical protein [Clostridiales bacterium]MDN5283541.1 hypothetical protein [Candidatus Ozemobacter sp.]